MAIANRSARLRRLAAKLTEQFGLPWGPTAIEPYYDETYREWSFRWPDGPTVAQVQRAARAAEPEATVGLKYSRRLSAETYALGVLRITLSSEPLNKDFDSPWIHPSTVEDLFEKTKNPKARAGREATIVANIVVQSEAHGRSWVGDGRMVCDYVADKGIAAFLTDVELTPLESLTAPYAQGQAERAWRRRLVPLTALEAFSAVQADEQAPPDAVAAALALLPELHAALDAAAAGLRARAALHEASGG